MSSENLEIAGNHLDSTALSRTVDIDKQCNCVPDSISDDFDEACTKQVEKDHHFECTAETLKLIRLKRKLRRLCQRQPWNEQLKTLYNRTNSFVSKEMQRERQAAGAVIKKQVMEETSTL